MKRKPTSFLIVGSTIVFSFFSSNHISAQNTPCGVGTKVAYNWSPETVGTIVEIGTTSPHVGWFGIKFSWTDKIEWAPPETNGLLIAGTKEPCVGKKATAKEPVKKNTDPATDKKDPVTKNKETADGGCSMSAPPGSVSRNSAPSAALFKRVIYEKAAVRVNPNSITAPSAVGMTFTRFEMGKPYKNTWTSTRFGDKRLHTGAPLNAMLYPIKTTEILCEQYSTSVRRTITEENRTCFKNKDGDWVCPAGGGGKFIESKVIEN